MLKEKIMIVDDDPYMRSALSLGLSKLNRKGEIFSSAEDALNYINKNSNDFSLIISDLNLSGMDGVSFLNEIKKIKDFKNTPFVIITAYGTIESAIIAIKNGAADYLLKPFSISDLENTIKNIEKIIYEKRSFEKNGINFIKNSATYDADTNDIDINDNNNDDDDSNKDINVCLDNNIKNSINSINSTTIINLKNHKNKIINDKVNNFVFLSEKMKKIESFINIIAPTDATVLITGESGTGKEVVAKYLHNKSGRNGNFIAVNCSAIVPTLLESELFGHEKGAFTGASARKTGKFELANNGTILLDEIGDMDKNLQSKILRTLQEHYIDRVGGDSPVHINTRVIAATNKDLKKMVEEGTFREDLFYRLNVLPIELPPLRDRKIDIKPLSVYFIKKYSKKYYRNINDISKDALDYLASLSYRGNVRELENIIERGVILAQNSDILNISHLSKFDIINSPINSLDNKLSKLSKLNYSADNNAIPDNRNNKINKGVSKGKDSTIDIIDKDKNIYNAYTDKIDGYRYKDIIEDTGIDITDITIDKDIHKYGYNYKQDDNDSRTNGSDEINERQNISMNNLNNMLNNSVNGNENNNIINNVINGDPDYNNNVGICDNSELFDVLSIKEMEKKLIAAALKKTGGNKNKASELLGVTARTLRNKLKEFEIQDK
jgi:DNA-binding NtrC family response regulator